MSKKVVVSSTDKNTKQLLELKKLLAKKGYSIVDESRSLNEEQNEVDIEQLLREQMECAESLIVLIGEEVLSEDLVNVEIELANKLGKKIIGILADGSSDSNVPEALNRYGNSLVGAGSGKVIDALEGRCTDFDNTNGKPRDNPYNSNRGTC
jgi:type II secretory pathway predicted ATPase ExeA